MLGDETVQSQRGPEDPAQGSARPQGDTQEEPEAKNSPAFMKIICISKGSRRKPVCKFLSQGLEEGEGQQKDTAHFTNLDVLFSLSLS